MKYIILIGLCMLLIGCNSNLSTELNRFCETRGYDTVHGIMDYNYGNTKVRCQNYSYWGFKIENEKIINISCEETKECIKRDIWDRCKKNYYSYSCGEIIFIELSNN